MERLCEVQDVRGGPGAVNCLTTLSHEVARAEDPLNAHDRRVRLSIARRPRDLVHLRYRISSREWCIPFNIHQRMLSHAVLRW